MGWVFFNEIPLPIDLLESLQKQSEEFGLRYREEYAELYNPKQHIGWTNQEYLEKEKVVYKEKRAKEIRYCFSDGRVIYASINALGMVFVPPYERHITHKSGYIRKDK